MIKNMKAIIIVKEITGLIAGQLVSTGNKAILSKKLNEYVKKGLFTGNRLNEFIEVYQDLNPTSAPQAVHDTYVFIIDADDCISLHKIVE